MRSKRAAPAGQRKYLVVGAATISVHTEVFASSEAEALELAANRRMMTLCHECAHGEPEHEWTTSGELDAEPTELQVEEA